VPDRPLAFSQVRRRGGPPQFWGNISGVNIDARARTRATIAPVTNQTNMWFHSRPYLGNSHLKRKMSTDTSAFAGSRKRIEVAQKTAEVPLAIQRQEAAGYNNLGSKVD
jgi:hypothetical protein